VDCEPRFALAAFTKDSDNQGENADQERINFQRGMGENYERLEFIGDTFLKTATTISTFIRNPDENEFEFHVRRMQMLCNKNLFGTALKLKLYEYIRSMSFNRRYWYPEGMKLLVGTGVIRGQEKEMFHEPREHGLGQKTIADVCEALIGAAFVSHDGQGEWTPEKWDHAVKAVTTFVDSSDHRMLRWQDYSAGYEKPQYQTAGATAVQKDLAQKVELEHAYTFKYPRLLYSAFMHPSVPFSHEKVPSYQRLEFLGDALLDQASITWLFYKYPDKDPQWLTEHKMAMVSNKFLGALCVDIGFHKHLRHYHAALQSLIQAYVTELEEAKAVAGDSRDYWTTVSDPPKCLPDIVEAYIGAMFIDSDFNYGQIQRFFDEHVKWYFADMRLYDTFANSHPCTHLHNMLQTTFGCGDYRLMAREVPAVDGVESADVIAVVMIHDRIMASSVGKSGRYARLRVANQALEKLDGLAPMDFRATYGCGCKVSTGEVLGSSGTYQQAVGQSRDLQADCDA
jgi:endoribonuclease Dicer